MFSKTTYEVLPQDEYNRDLINHATRPNRFWQLIQYTITLIFVVTISFTAGVQYNKWPSTESFGIELAWSSELASLPTSWRKFDGNFNFLGFYKGQPTKEIDEAWARYSMTPWIDGTGAVFPVTEEDIRKSRKATDEAFFNTSVKFDEKDGGGYMGTIEMFHQLHCLNMIRMSVRPEHYIEELHYNTTERILEKHIDHCIDMIRQVIMCTADTSLLTFHWVKDNPFPYPDFSTWHKCRNPETVLDWALQRQPPYTSLPRKGRDNNRDSIDMPKAP